MPKSFAELFGNDDGDLLPKTPLVVMAVPGPENIFQPRGEVRTVPVPTPSTPQAEVTLDDLKAAPFGYLSGPAGTGKTFLARQLVGALPGASLVATTGIAAVNLGDAVTINSLLRYFDTKSLIQDFHAGWLQMKLRKLRRSGLRRIVLDEVSMLDADQLTHLCWALDEVNKTAAYDGAVDQVDYEDDDRLGLLLVGDFAQLPPVKAAFAFESPEWGRFAEHTWKLTTVRRQTDQEFVQGLMAVRRGDVGPVLDLFRPQISLESDLNFPGTTIVAKNDIVDRINMTRHAKITGELLTFQTIRAGEQQADWLKQIPHQTQVKVGSLVMILANRYAQLGEGERELLYANGDLGEVLGKGTSGVLVKLQRTGEVQEVIMVTREWREPTGKKKPPYTVKGSVSYLPLRLAYATTVHKSQGLSLDRVQVNILDRFFGSPSMLYVALSRARTLEGLHIVGTPKLLQDRCAVDPQIQGWI